MEPAGQARDLFTELKKMQRKCSEDGQFPSKADFHEWVDVVDSLLAYYPDVQSAFRNKVESVDIAYRLGIPIADSENEAIRVLNRHLLSLEMKPMFPSEADEKHSGDHAPDHADRGKDVPQPKSDGLPWFQRPIGVVFLMVVAGVVTAVLAAKIAG